MSKNGREWTHWDSDYLDLAEFWAKKKSKDPSTQVGAIIADKQNRIVSLAYNGFPVGIVDTDERLNDRTRKYELIVHAEVNAILFSNKDVRGCTLYTWPFLPCCRCAGIVINSGIRRVCTTAPLLNHERWGTDFLRTLDMFEEAGVEALFKSNYVNLIARGG